MMYKPLRTEIIFSNGVRFEGRPFGHISETAAEAVAVNGSVGYQEIITNPAYAGKIAVMTYPLMGNYGINLDDMESPHALIKALVVREKCDKPNNFRCEMELDGFLKQRRITGVEGVDTRALAKMLMKNPGLKAVITPNACKVADKNLAQLFETCDGGNMIDEVTTKETYTINGNGAHLAIIDFGITNSLKNMLTGLGYKLTVFPAQTPAEEILRHNTDGILLSDGPATEDAIEQTDVSRFVGTKPVFGVSFGCIVLARSLGLNIAKLSRPRHGSSYPVKDTQNGRIYVTAQNQDFHIVKPFPHCFETYINLSDNTAAGFKCTDKKAAGVCFFPEAHMPESFFEKRGSI